MIGSLPSPLHGSNVDSRGCSDAQKVSGMGEKRLPKCGYSMACQLTSGSGSWMMTFFRLGRADLGLDVGGACLEVDCLLLRGIGATWMLNLSVNANLCEI